MPRLAVVNSDNVTLVVGAIPITDGRADPFVSLVADEEQFSTDGASADGHTIRYQTNNQLYTVTVTLKGSSSHNGELSALHIADAVGGSGTGVGAFLLEDGDGSTLCAASECWIKKMPDKEFGRAPSDVAWEFGIRSPTGTMVVGGN